MFVAWDQFEKLFIYVYFGSVFFKLPSWKLKATSDSPFAGCVRLSEIRFKFKEVSYVHQGFSRYLSKLFVESARYLATPYLQWQLHGMNHFNHRILERTLNHLEPKPLVVLNAEICLLCVFVQHQDASPFQLCPDIALSLQKFPCLGQRWAWMVVSSALYYMAINVLTIRTYADVYM